MGSSESKLIVDALYGLQSLDQYLADLVEQPELQRLRDVRLSNINSTSLSGAANISRFEHSVGTAILARCTAIALGLDDADRHKLVLAALLHDIAITPFGHLMEEAFAYAGMVYDHEGRMLQILQGKAEHGTVDFQIFRGQSVGFRRVLARRPYSEMEIDPSEVLQIIQGKGRLGPLINGTIDLDNIDNVCRMAYHIGIGYRRGLPLKLAQAFSLRNNSVFLRADKADLIDEWLQLRFRLYSTLMTNPTDFSAKAMLVEAFRLALSGTKDKPPVLSESSWSLTDSDLMQLLASSELTTGLIRRFEIGDLFSVVNLYWISADRFKAIFSDIPSACKMLRLAVATKAQVSSEEILFYGIRDKRIRPIPSEKWDGRDQLHQPIECGAIRQQFLLGCVAGKISHVAKIRKALTAEIESRFGADACERCDPDAVLQGVFENDVLISESQGSLF